MISVPVARPLSESYPWGVPQIAGPPAPNDLYLVTALVSTYKSEFFFRGCLEDLVAQTLFKKSQLEILVIDSGSPESEHTIVEEFRLRHSNIHYVRTERESLYAAWNRGIKLARGRFLTNANVDDRHREDALEKLASWLEEHPETALVYGDMRMTSVPNQTFAVTAGTRHYALADATPMALLGEERCGPHPMWRKALHFELGGFSEDFKVASDYEWCLRVLQKYPLHHMPEPLSLYLKRADSLEHRHLAICEAETQTIRQFYCKQFGIDPGQLQLRPKASLPRFFWRLRRSIRKRTRRLLA